METLYALILIVNGQVFTVDEHLTWADCHPMEVAGPEKKEDFLFCNQE